MKFLTIGLSICLAAVLISCSKKDNPSGPEGSDGKARVELAGQIDPEPKVLTRAEDYLGFEQLTKIALRIMSEQSGSTSVKYTNTTATVKQRETALSLTSDVEFTTAETRYWDDLYGREGQLSIYSVGVPGKTSAITLSSDNNNLDWSVSTTQSSTTYSNEDLILSRNIIKISESSDLRMKYNSTAFDKGTLKFSHALSKIKVNLIMGTGFSAADFVNPNITLKGFYNKGTLDISTGAFTVSGATSNIVLPQVTADATILGCVFSFEGLVIPSRNWSTNSDLMEVVVNGHTYKINTSNFNTGAGSNLLTGNMLANAQYTFNLSITKTGVSVTAALMDWQNKSFELTPVIINSDVANGQTVTGGEVKIFDLYRSTSKDTGYDENTSTADAIDYATTCTLTASGWTYSPDIYWADHVTAVNYRALALLDEAGSALTDHATVSSAGSKDYVQVVTAASNTKSGKDLCFGAPLKSDKTTIEDPMKAENGAVTLTFKHKLSEIFVQLTTTDGTDKIDLTNATVEITNSITKGNLMLGTGAYSAYSESDRTDSYSMGTVYNTLKRLPGDTADKETAYTNVFRCYALPQALNTTGKEIQFKITAAGNTYYVNAAQSTTTSWAEGIQYLYKFNIKGTVVGVTSSIINWDTNAVVSMDVQL